MMVVAVIAILGAIALPAYNDFIIRGRIPDATSHLAAKRVQMEQFYQDNRTYASAPPCASDAASSKYFTFSCSVAGTATVFTCRRWHGDDVRLYLHRRSSWNQDDRSRSLRLGAAQPQHLLGDEERRHLLMRINQDQRGLTMIELMIGLTIFTMLLLLGAPSFSAWIQSSHIRTPPSRFRTG
jgi:prepilin-type N-terminal cleavage/methylation domain-containing protein